MEVAQQIRYFVAVDRQIGSQSSRSNFGWRRISVIAASGVGSQLRLASASVVCVCVSFIWGRLGVGCRQWAASERGCGWWVSGRVRRLPPEVGCYCCRAACAVVTVLFVCL